MESDDNCLGAFAGVAIRDGRGIRSENPCHSMVVFGDRERAKAFVEGELLVSAPTAPESCYGMLIEMGGFVLLAGVAHNKNTCLHTVDEMLNTPNRMDEKLIPVAVKRANGEVVKRQIRLFLTDYTEDISWRFPKYETAFRYHRCITDGFVGNAPTQLCNAVKMKETIELIYKNCGENDPLRDEEPIPQKWYTEEK
jgi:aminoglycoside 3-N-acetyltransferase